MISCYRLITNIRVFRDDIYVENFDMIIMVDYTNPHIYEEFDETLVKMIFSITNEEPDFTPPADCQQVYHSADSIATVVADYIVRNDPQNLTDDDKLSLKILYGKRRGWNGSFVVFQHYFFLKSDCILYQIDNKRDEELYPEDTRMLSDLEGFLGMPDESYAETLLDELVNAYVDYSQLNAMQLLYKYSAGMIYGKDERAVYIAVLPIRMKDFFEMPAFRTGVADLAETMCCNVMIVIATCVDEQNNTKEDIAIIGINDSCLYKKILDKMVYSSNLKLLYRGWFHGCNGKWYRNYKPEVTVDEIKADVQAILDA